MKRLAAFILLASLLAATSSVDRATPPAASAPANSRITFVPVHVYIDPHGKPLACYQVRIVATAGDVKLVGIEGGDSAAFNKAPYYDPRALQGNRVVLGAYSLDGDLPSHNTRVATLMVRVAGDVAPVYEATLAVAGTSDATEIDATVSLVENSHGNGEAR